MIYVIKESGTSLYKIGYTRDRPEQRIGEIQTSKGRKVVILYIFEGTRADEAYLHKVFDQYRQHGEWFDLDMKRLTGVLINLIFGEERIALTEDRGVMQKDHVLEFLKEFNLSRKPPENFEDTISDEHLYKLYQTFCRMVNVRASDQLAALAAITEYPIGFKKKGGNVFFNMKVKSTSILEGH